MGELLRHLGTWSNEVTGLRTETWERLAQTAVTIVVLWLARLLLLRFIVRRGKAAERDEETITRGLYQWRQGTAYAAYGLGFLLVGQLWIESFESLATIMGLVSAGIAVALKDPLVNVAGWLFIVWKKPFEIGDRVEVGEYRGDVVGQHMFSFSLMEVGAWVDADERTGRLLVAPNGVVFTDTIANYSKGWFEQIWDEKRVVVTFESNWRAARRLLVDIAHAHGQEPSEAARGVLLGGAQQFVVLQTNFEPQVYVSVEDSGVALTLRYMCRPFARRRTAEAIWLDVLAAFETRDDIDFAYPTIRYYDRGAEARPR